jgi:hypothetical protein
MRNLLILVTFVALLGNPFKLHCQNQQPAPGAKWEEFEGVRVPVPPPEHPRLYLRSSHIPELRERLKRPELQDVITRIKASKLPEVRMEWKALDYLLNRDPQTARDAIAGMAAQMTSPKIRPGGEKSNPKIQPDLKHRDSADAGILMVAGAIVYD